MSALTDRVTRREIRRAFGNEALNTVGDLVQDVGLLARRQRQMGETLIETATIVRRGFFGRLKWLLTGK